VYSHIVVGSNDIEKSRKFYDAAFGAMGAGPAPAGDRLIYSVNGGMFMVTRPINGEAACFANGGTIGFAMKDADQCKAWHDAGAANGGTTCEDPPGERDFGGRKLYLAYMRDPDGNKLCGMVPLA